ncbi:hypothetical protein [Cognaticolwellia aestuarii]|uniref:hypothetical protein n=1 Tax=Cognaticolwellia aestuarii TaxID=329993 RepID=UPI000987242C|nr:hypothetical protein [Cognaticolwellia aestuarii]
MNENDLAQIRKVIREEIGDFLREVYNERRRDQDEFRHPSMRHHFEEELNRFAMLNDRFSSYMKAGDLMKGCKYSKSTVDEISENVKNIDSKT